MNLKKQICLLCSSMKISKINFSSGKINFCNQCTLQFIDKPNTIKNDYFHVYNKFRSPHSSLTKLRLKQYKIDAKFLQQHIKFGNILDIGCSDGQFLNQFAKNKNLKLFGLDPDSTAIELAKRNFPKISFDNNNLINYKTKLKYDCLVFRGSFQFLGTELKDTLKKIQKISTKKSKIIIFSLPNSDSFLFHILKDKWNLFDRDSHKLIFNTKSIEKLCQIYNYELTHISYPYLNTVYSNLSKDYNTLIRSIKSGNPKNVPFWGNMMQIVLQKSKN